MPSAAAHPASRRREQEGVPVGRILSAADYAKLCAGERDTETPRLRRLPSLHEQARAHGYQLGMQAAFTELSAVMIELQRCREDRDAWIRSFLFAVLRKILGRAHGATLIPSIVERAVEECDLDVRRISVHVPAATVTDVTKSLNALSREGSSRDLQIDVVSQERLHATECEIHTPFGIIDASLDTQLDALQHALNADRQMMPHVQQ